MLPKMNSCYSDVPIKATEEMLTVTARNAGFANFVFNPEKNYKKILLRLNLKICVQFYIHGGTNLILRSIYQEKTIPNDNSCKLLLVLEPKKSMI
jgi:hypothetical protein